MTIIAAATADATRNGFDTATDGIVINNPPTSGPNQVDGSVEVIISRQMPLFFTAAFFSLIGATTQQFKATARAVVNTSIVDEFCILGLDPTGAKSVEVTGNGTATLNCGVAVNSDADNALSISGNATPITTSVSTVGNIDLVGGGTLNSESPPERGAVIVDPLKDLVIPTFQGAGDPDPGDNEDIDDGCDKGTYGQGQSGGYTATTDLNASDYGGTMVICGGFTVAAGTTINLGPGIYIIDQGDFEINAGASITGSGVTIILTSSGDDSKIGNFQVNGGADITLSAPVDDPDDAPGYGGVLFYQDRNVSSGPTNNNLFTGGAELDLEGFLYFPSQDVSFKGGSEVGSRCTRLIGQKVTITGNTNLATNCPTSEDAHVIGKLVASLGE